MHLITHLIFVTVQCKICIGWIYNFYFLFKSRFQPIVISHSQQNRKQTILHIGKCRALLGRGRLISIAKLPQIRNYFSSLFRNRFICKCYRLPYFIFTANIKACFGSCIVNRIFIFARCYAYQQYG